MVRISLLLLLIGWLLQTAPALQLPLKYSYRYGSLRSISGECTHWRANTDTSHLPRLLALKQSRNDGGNDEQTSTDMQRRTIWKKVGVQAISIALGGVLLSAVTRPVWAIGSRSRTIGYEVQKSEAEWKSQLSPLQYYILREGGTERPGFSILDKEKKAGQYKCAGCDTPLFSSEDKFNSRTGWPSFASGLPSVDEETEGNALLAAASSLVSGVELRCHTCGGHLGDVFRDGFLFIGTPAAITGKRYCIDGAALVFQPNDDLRLPTLRGDTPAQVNGSASLPSFLDAPKIIPRERD